MDNFFNYYRGWIGGDAIYSAPLPDGSILWLFGDTLIGTIRDGKRSPDTIMVNNTIAIQKGTDPATARITTYARQDEEGRWQSVFTPPHGDDFFWIYDGILAPDGLYIFLIQIHVTDKDQAFGFHSAGTAVARIDNPQDPPDKWRTTLRKIPFGTFVPGGETFFGSAALIWENHMYIYGITEETGEGYHRKYMITARVPADDPLDYEKWRFYDGNDWSKDFQNAKRLADDFANEYTVSYNEFLKQFIVVYTRAGNSPDICLRMSPAPWGPWSDPVVLYRCPEEAMGPGLLIYAGKHHPVASSDDDTLIISYVTNLFTLPELLNDARWYWPRFLQVKLTPADKPAE